MNVLVTGGVGYLGSHACLELLEEGYDVVALDNLSNSSRKSLERVGSLSFIWNIVILRYFNPVGAHSSGMIGENPKGIPNNLMPYVTQAALGKLPELGVFGGDYDTPDGTCIRDYIHVVDLIDGHVKAIKKLYDKSGLSIYNLGTGNGCSVLELVHNFEKATGVKVPYKIKGRRAGDIPVCYSDPSKAYEELGWKAEYGIFEMCRDAWNWQMKNPNGYE